jgi:hypothetical protein
MKINICILIESQIAGDLLASTQCDFSINGHYKYVLSKAQSWWIIRFQLIFVYYETHTIQIHTIFQTLIPVPTYY